MNWTQIEGKWEQVKGDAKAQWAKLTDDDLRVVGGRLESLAGKIVERYGVKKEQAHKDIEQWAHRMRDKLDEVGKKAERHADAAKNLHRDRH